MVEMFILGLLVGFTIRLGWGAYKSHLDAEYLKNRSNK